VHLLLFTAGKHTAAALKYSPVDGVVPVDQEAHVLLEDPLGIRVGVKQSMALHLIAAAQQQQVGVPS
jgi:hypothetical protein